MQVEELLKMLRDAGMADEDIKGLLHEAMKMLEPKPVEEQGEHHEPEESDEEKFGRVFGL